MKPLRFLLAALALLALSACFTSKEPLVGEDAVTPHASITFLAEGEDAKPVVFTRDGNGYVTHGDEGDVLLHLKPVEGDYYVAQLTGPDPNETPRYLYAYMRLDGPGKVADTWLTVGSADDVRPGLSTCDDVICIDDLNAYIAFAKEKIAAGETPDTTFEIAVE